MYITISLFSDNTDDGKKKQSLFWFAVQCALICDLLPHAQAHHTSRYHLLLQIMSNNYIWKLILRIGWNTVDFRCVYLKYFLFASHMEIGIYQFRWLQIKIWIFMIKNEILFWRRREFLSFNFQICKNISVNSGNRLVIRIFQFYSIFFTLTEFIISYEMSSFDSGKYRSFGFPCGYSSCKAKKVFVCCI